MTPSPPFGDEALPLKRTVGIGGLGTIGFAIAEWLDGYGGDLELAAVSAKNLERARSRVAHFRRPPTVVAPAELAASAVVIEAAPGAAFDEIAIPAIESGRTLIVASVGALISRMHLIDRARRTGAHIIVPSGALAGLDAIRAAAIGVIDRVTLETRKLPAALAGAPHLVRNGIDPQSITQATCVFRGNALEAAAGFPANANVAAALALAGIGPLRTQVEIWADPGVTRNTHTVRVDADCGRLTLCVESTPSKANPRTSRIAPQSLIASLLALDTTLKVGS